MYSTYLPKNTHPFVYLSLELDPGDIDVNVHPTKHEVHFLNEEQIIETLTTALEAKLLGSNNSRVFYTQAKLPKVFNVTSETLQGKDGAQVRSVNPKDFVRTDAKEQKIEKFFGAPIKKDDANEVKVNQNAPFHELNAIPEQTKIDVSLTEEEFQKQHELFAERNEKFEDRILNQSANSILEGKIICYIKQASVFMYRM